LFGHEKGAFTGAIEVHQGYFERAKAAPCFWMKSIHCRLLHNRLLRVIRKVKLERVGGKQTLPVNLRIISATNQNLENLVNKVCFVMIYITAST